MNETPAAVVTAVIKRLAWLDLSSVQQRFERDEGTKLTHGVLSKIGLEYRRVVFLRMR